MAIEILLFVIAMGAHFVIYKRSRHSERGKRLVVALMIIAASIPVMVLGVLVGLSGDKQTQMLAYLLLYAPLYMTLFSFIVYRRRTVSDVKLNET